MFQSKCTTEFGCIFQFIFSLNKYLFLSKAVCLGLVWQSFPSGILVLSSLLLADEVGCLSAFYVQPLLPRDLSINLSMVTHLSRFYHI